MSATTALEWMSGFVWGDEEEVAAGNAVGEEDGVPSETTPAVTDPIAGADARFLAEPDANTVLRGAYVPVQDTDAKYDEDDAWTEVEAMKRFWKPVKRAIVRKTWKVLQDARHEDGGGVPRRRMNSDVNTLITSSTTQPTGQEVRTFNVLYGITAWRCIKGKYAGKCVYISDDGRWNTKGCEHETWCFARGLLQCGADWLDYKATAAHHRGAPTAPAVEEGWSRVGSGGRRVKQHLLSSFKHAMNAHRDAQKKKDGKDIFVPNWIPLLLTTTAFVELRRSSRGKTPSAGGRPAAQREQALLAEVSAADTYSAALAAASGEGGAVAAAASVRSRPPPSMRQAIEKAARADARGSRRRSDDGTQRASPRKPKKATAIKRAEDPQNPFDALSA